MALAERYMKNNCACFTPNPGRVEDIIRLAGASKNLTLPRALLRKTL